MKNTRRFSHLCRLAVYAAAAFSLSSSANAEVPKKWSELRVYLQGKYVTILTKDGKSQHGRFLGTSPEAVILDDGDGFDRRDVQVPRTSFTMIRVDLEPANLEKFGWTLHRGYTHAFHRLFSEGAPLGIIEVPAITAYAVVTAPFCALGDLFARPKGMTENVQIVD